MAGYYRSDRTRGRALSNRRRNRSSRTRQSRKGRGTPKPTLDKKVPAPDPPPGLPPIVADLHGVLGAIAGNADGLSRQWAQRFDKADYSAATESDRTLLSSFLAQIYRSVQLQEAAASSVGTVSAIPQYPVPLAEMPRWRSSAPANELWLHQITAVLHALQAYISALEGLGKPGRIEFAQGRTTHVEFEPMRSAVLHQQGRLLAEVLEEAAVTLAGLTEGMPLELGVAPDNDGPYQQLVRSYRLAHDLGSPEASLLHLVRYLSRQESPAAKDHAELIETARSELQRYASGEPTSRGVALMLADALARVVDESQGRTTLESQKDARPGRHALGPEGDSEHE